MSESQSIVDVVMSAGEADLKKIDAQIKDLYAEIQATRNKINSLKEVRKIIDIRLNGKPKPEPGKAKQMSNGQSTKLAEKVYDLIFVNGSLPIDVIAARLGKTPQAIRVSVGRSAWFSVDGDEVKIAK